MNLVLFVTLVAVTLLAWFSLLKILPACSTSRLRYQLWAIRDETMDELLAGEYENTEEVQNFIRRLEIAIAVAPDLSLLNLIAFNRMMRGARPPNHVPFDLDALSPTDRERIEPRFTLYEWLLVRNAFLGSPSGWVFLVFFLVPTIILASLRGRGSFRPLVREEAGKIRADPALALLLQRRRRRPVSAYM